jgi:hypothetical protein
MTVQALLDATPAGGVARLPAGEIRVPSATSWRVPRPMTLDGAGSTIVVEGATAGHLFDASDLRGGTLAVRNVTVAAPDAEGTSVHSAVIWSRSKTPDSLLVVEDCSIRGAWNAAVQRSGGGHVTMRRSTLEAWSAPIKVFESHNHGSGHTLTVEDCRLLAAPSNAVDSIGAYIHPHIATTFRRTSAVGFGRWAVYANGTPAGAGVWLLEDVTAVDCSLVQAPGSSSTLVLDGCREVGAARNGGTLLRGRVRSTRCEWSGRNGYGLLPGVADIAHVGDVFCRTRGYVTGAGRGVAGRVRVVDSVVRLSGDGRLVLITADADPGVDVALVRCDVTVAEDHQRPHQISVVRAGTLTVAGTTIPAPDVTAPGLLVHL